MLNPHGVAADATRQAHLGTVWYVLFSHANSEAWHRQLQFLAKIIVNCNDARRGFRGPQLAGPVRPVCTLNVAELSNPVRVGGNQFV